MPLTPQVRARLGLPRPDALTPPELMRAVLAAPVDLLWNGGIGTYVKASTETHAQVGDKANDAIRVDGGELRARVVGEGGNLGLTQLGRVEYALAGGRLNTDAIDNSAGVDTSDHEVNFKILLQEAVRDGELDEADAQRAARRAHRRRRRAGAAARLRAEPRARASARPQAAVDAAGARAVHGAAGEPRRAGPGAGVPAVRGGRSRQRRARPGWA